MCNKLFRRKFLELSEIKTFVLSGQPITRSQYWHLKPNYFKWLCLRQFRARHLSLSINNFNLGNFVKYSSCFETVASAELKRFEDEKQLANILSMLSNVTTISLINCTLLVEGFSWLIYHLQSTVLNITINIIHNEGFNSFNILQLFEKCKLLQKLKLFGFKRDTTSNNKKRNFHNDNFYWIDLIVSSEHLTHLHLAGNALDNISSQHVTQLLNKFPNLAFYDVGSFEADVEFLQNTFQKHTNLTTLNTGLLKFTDLTSTNKKLEIKLTHTNISNLASLLNTLTIIQFDYDVTLTISYFVSVEHITSVTSCLSTVQHFSFNGVRFDDVRTLPNDWLSNFAIKNKTLKTVCITRCENSLKNDSFIDFLVNSSKIEEITISESNKLTNTVLDFISLSMLPNLRKVNLCHNKYITYAGLLSLQNRLPNVEVVLPRLESRNKHVGSGSCFCVIC
jgi:hypothetical protein